MSSPVGTPRKDSASMMQLELNIPMMGSSKCSCLCLNRNYDSNVVIRKDAPVLELQKLCPNGLSIVETTRKVHQIIMERCHGDLEKFQLICEATQIDPMRPEEGLKFKQMVALQSLFLRVFHEPLMNDNS